MGNSHFTSNIEADGDSVTIAGFSEVSATALVGATITGTTITDGTTSLSAGAVSGASTISGTTISASGVLSGANVRATNYLKIGSRYIFTGSVTESSASIVSAASSLVTTASLKGSLFCNASPCNLWFFTATMTAATKFN